MATLGELRKRFYNRFDEGQINYVAVDEANALINEGAAHLHNWLINAAEFYIWSEIIIPTVRGQMDYSLPADFYKSLKVFSIGSTGAPATYRPLDRMMPEEFRGAAVGNCYGSSAYMIIGSKLRLMPAPSQNGNGIALWYAPVFTPMVADTDTTSVSVAPGWEEFIINQAVIGARIKEESDTVQLERRQTQIMTLMEASIVNRDMGRHQHVVDVDDGF